MSLREGLVLLLELCEQPHVLYRDDRLVGEGLEQYDLLVREGPSSGPRYRDRPNGLVITQHRHREDASKLRRFCDAPVRILGILEDVHDVGNAAAQNRPSRRAATARWHWVHVPNR